jgi:hypothetical protein
VLTPLRSRSRIDAQILDGGTMRVWDNVASPRRMTSVEQYVKVQQETRWATSK